VLSALFVTIVVFTYNDALAAQDNSPDPVNPYQSSCDAGDWSSCERATQYNQQYSVNVTQGVDTRGTSLSEADRLNEARNHEQNTNADPATARANGAVMDVISQSANVTNMYQAADASRRANAAGVISLRAATAVLGIFCSKGAWDTARGVQYALKAKAYIAKAIACGSLPCSGLNFALASMADAVSKFYLLKGVKLLVACPMAAMTAVAGSKLASTRGEIDEIVAKTQCNDPNRNDCGGTAFAPVYEPGTFPYDWDGDGIPNDQDPSPGAPPYQASNFPNADLDGDGDVDQEDRNRWNRDLPDRNRGPNIAGENGNIWNDPRMPAEFRDTPQFFDAMISQLKAKGYQLNAKTGILKTPYGKTHVDNMLTPQGLRAMGLKPEDGAEMAALQGNLKKLLTDSQKLMNTSLASLGFGSEGGSPTALGAAQQANGNGAQGLNNGGRRGPASAPEGVGGLAVNHNGDPIGVAGDNLFRMMSRRYRIISGDGRLWTLGAVPAVNNPSSNGATGTGAR
jgi:hypothetical protein